MDKQCTKCKEFKTFQNFYKVKRNLGGLSHDCKCCRLKSVKKYQELNSEKVLLQNTLYRKSNKEIIKSRKREYNQHKCKTDPIYVLKNNCRRRLYKAFKAKSWNKKNTSNELLNCSYEELKLHIENQFTEGMSWENHGKWHIDHIIPLSSTNNESELIKLCHYTNLQPLWAFDNLSKGNKIL